MPNQNKVDLAKQKNEFRRILDMSQRLIISAPFGMGKTTFIKEYFAENSDIYNHFHLFPILYQAYYNEDVFEMIKYDLLVQLINKDQLDINREQNLLKDLYHFIGDKGVETFWNVTLHSVPILSNVSKAMDQIQKSYQEYKQDKLEKTPGKLISQFVKKYELNYHEDLISAVIRKHLDIMRSSVLIIDDLDRIDPEHIFRLFNVFSAHFDINSLENKFGFDKIIFVCDIQNIKNIFANKYGQDTDFSGYIDKFYNHVYHFQHSQGLIEFIYAIIRLNRSSYRQVRKDYKQSVLLFREFLVFLNRVDKLSLRTVQMIAGFDFNSFHLTSHATAYNLAKSDEDRLFIEFRYFVNKFFPYLRSAELKLNYLAMEDKEEVDENVNKWKEWAGLWSSKIKNFGDVLDRLGE